MSEFRLHYLSAACMRGEPEKCDGRRLWDPSIRGDGRPVWCACEGLVHSDAEKSRQGKEWAAIALADLRHPKFRTSA